MTNQSTAKEAQALVEQVGKKIREFQSAGELHFPANYDPENALKAAWLRIQEAQDKNHKPALEVCTKTSIYNALLNMAVQGLNPIKDQCYFIVYGNQLVCQRSYFGSVVVAKRVDPRIKAVSAQVIYEKDEFEYEIRDGYEYVTTHKRKLANIDPNNIIAAYAVITYHDDSCYMEIMTMADIKKSWAKSKLNPDSEKSTHSQFKEEMAKKTVISRATKRIIKSSDDSDLAIQQAQQTDEEIDDAKMQDEIDEMETVDIDMDNYKAEEPGDQEDKNATNEDEQGKEQSKEQSKEQGKKEGKSKESAKSKTEAGGETGPDGQPEMNF